MTRPLEPFEQHEAILRERGICLWCHQSSCAVYAHDDYDAHERCWRSGASRRPWWSLAEFAALVLRNEAIAAKRARDAEQRRRAEASAKEGAEALDELRRRMGGGRP